MVFGAAIAIASWRMDRLEHMGATLYTAPGLVPGILGLVIVLLGVLLALRGARGRGGPARPDAAGGAGSTGGARVALVLALCLAYAAVLVGRAPFWLATFLFVAVFIALFEAPMRSARGRRARGIAMALVYGAATSALVTYVFQELFLVRLP